MSADTALRPIDYNTWLASDPPEHKQTEDDDAWYAEQRARYLPDDCNPPY